MLQRDDLEHPVPEAWQSTFRQIADAFAAGDFQLLHRKIDGVRPLDQATANSIAENIAAYGAPLASLDDATWEHSVCRWMDSHWLVLVDLSTVQEPVSDLTLHAKVYEGERLRLHIHSVHVP